MNIPLFQTDLQNLLQLIDSNTNYYATFETTLAVFILIYFTIVLFLLKPTLKTNKITNALGLYKIISHIGLILSGIILTFGLYTFVKPNFCNNITQTFIFENNHNTYFVTHTWIMLIKILLCFIIHQILIAIKNSMVFDRIKFWEIPFFIIFALFFLLLISSANDIFAFYMSLIGFNITMFLLMFSNPMHSKIRQGTIKYYYLSSISATLIGFGMSLLASTFYNDITFNYKTVAYTINVILLNANPSQIVTLIIGMTFIIVGILFKLTAFPAMLWMTDVYDSCNYTTLAILLLPAKLAIFVGFLRLLKEAFVDLHFIWEYLLVFSAIGSMLWGSLNAINEQNIKRFLGYSSMSQIGFILMGLTVDSASSEYSSAISLFYMLIYIIMNLIVFLVLLWTKYLVINVSEKINIRTFENYSKNLTFEQQFLIKNLSNTTISLKDTEIKTFSQLNLLLKTNPGIMFLLTIPFFSMAGIPPLIGFFGKFLLIKIVFEWHGFFLAFTMLATSLISAYYYIKIIQLYMFHPILSVTTVKNKTIDLILCASKYQINTTFIISTLLLIFASGFYTTIINYLYFNCFFS